MLDRVGMLLGLKAKDNEKQDHGLALAAAALMVQVSKADGDFSTLERDELTARLIDHFDLGADEAGEIITRAEREQSDATCLFAFTRTLAKELDNDERQEIIRLMWQVANADDEIDNFEENVLAKIAGLLGVSSADRIRLKHEVAGV